MKFVGPDFKFLPKGYSAPASVDFFGDHVNIVSNIHLGGVDEFISFTVIVNAQIAEAFRIWFKFMWDFCPEIGTASKAKRRISKSVRGGKF